MISPEENAANVIITSMICLTIIVVTLILKLI